MEFKDRVKLILEVKEKPDFSWNKYISSRIPDEKKSDESKSINKKTFIEELDEAIDKSRKYQSAEITGLLLAKQIYLKYNKN